MPLKKSSNLLAGLLLMGALTVPFAAEAKCNVGPFNPVDHVVWNAIAPIYLGGVKIYSGSYPDAGGAVSETVCVCKDEEDRDYFGFDIAYWEPNILIESVNDPYCSPSLGNALSSLDNGFRGGGRQTKVHSPKNFMQAHTVTFPLFFTMGILADMTCPKKGGVNLSRLTEFEPQWNDATLAAEMSPKTYLLASPPFELACVTKVVSTHLSLAANSNLDPVSSLLWWCGWGGIYVLTGDTNQPNALEAAAQNALRMIYMEYDFGMIQDNVREVCRPMPTYTPDTGHWRFSLALPVKSAKAFLIGESTLLWDVNKQPSLKDGNFLFVTYQKKRCCEKIYRPGD